MLAVSNSNFTDDWPTKSPIRVTTSSLTVADQARMERSRRTDVSMGTAGAMFLQAFAA